MRQARPLALTIMVTSALVACSSIVGFGELQRVGDDDSEALEHTDDAQAPVKDSGQRRDVSAPEDDASSDVDATIPPATTTCPAPAPTYYPAFKKPAATGSKPCTSQDLQAFLQNERTPFDDQKAKMTERNTACAECIYREETDPAWGPMTRTLDQRTFVDFGLCYSRAGASDACSVAAHELEWCIQKICNVCTGGMSLTDCRGATVSTSGACFTRLEAVRDECSSFATIVNTTCRSSREVVGVLCGGI